MACNVLLTAANEEAFFSSRETALKAVLFTKKTETPGLWLRLVESFGGTCSFGEVRLAEHALMDKFGVSVDSLPRVVAVVGAKGQGQDHDRRLPYEGPTDFESISAFLRDTSKAGAGIVDLRKELSEQSREIKGLKAELEREREAVKTARAEVARSKLGHVGQVEAVKRGLEAELQEARDKEKAAQFALQAETDRAGTLVRSLESQVGDLEAQVKAYKDLQSERVLMLTDDNLDVFLASTTRPLKAVLFTTKAETPALWSQLAEAQSMTTAFGVVKHTQAGLMEKFALDVEELPRICIWSSEKDDPIVYDGEVKLDALSSFLKDAVHGGDTVIAMRQQVHNAVRRIEDLEAELKRVTIEAAAKDEEAQRLRSEEADAHAAEIEKLQAQLQNVTHSSEAELTHVSQSARTKLIESELRIQTLERELMSERTSMTRQLELAHAKAAADVAQERDMWANSREEARIMQEEVQALEKVSRQVDRAVGRAASAVQVALVRKNREMERMQRSMRDFIDDVAPAQLQAAVYDAETLRATIGQVRGAQGDSSEGLLSAVGAITQQYKTLKRGFSERINGLDLLGDRSFLEGLDPLAKTKADSSSDKYVGAKTKTDCMVQLEQARGSDTCSLRSGDGVLGGVMQAPASDYSSLHGTVCASAGDDAKPEGSMEQRGDRDDVAAKRLARALAADPSRLQRERKKQARDLVSLPGLDEDMTIGKLTRECTKASERNTFLWGGRRLRLLYDGGLRDRLIDDESGCLVYAYPRALELAKAMLKLEQASISPAEHDSDAEKPNQSNGHAHAEQKERTGESAGLAATRKAVGDGNRSLRLGGFSLFRSPRKKTARMPLSSIDVERHEEEPSDPSLASIPRAGVGSRQIHSKNDKERERMPAFIGGMVVLAPPKETAEVLQRDAIASAASDSASAGRWSPRSNSSDEDDTRSGGQHASAGTGAEIGISGGKVLSGSVRGNGQERKLAGRRAVGAGLGGASGPGGDEELGAWGHAAGLQMAVQSIWSDEEA